MWIAVGAALMCVFALAVFVYGKVDPESSPFFPKCLFFSLTGLKCPGCGSQRAIHQLLNGHLLKALQYNALIVAAIPYVLAGCLFFLCNRNLYDRFYREKAAWVVLILIVLFWGLRNIFDF